MLDYVFLTKIRKKINDSYGLRGKIMTVKLTSAARQTLAAFTLVVAPVALTATAVQAQSSSNMIVEADIGWSLFDLPGQRFTIRKDFISPSPTTQEPGDHDGDVDGYRIGFGIFRQFGFSGSLKDSDPHPNLILGVTGFYSHMEEDQSKRCLSLAPSWPDGCGFSNFFDPDPTTFNIPIDASDLTTVTNREVDHYGVALEARRPHESASRPTFWKAGLAFRAIDQKNSLEGSFTGLTAITATSTAALNEDIDTRYYGAYVGMLQQIMMANGLALIVDGEIGLYYARTNYDGRLSIATANPAGVVTTSRTYDQTQSLDKSKAAAIAKLKLSLEKNLGPVNVGIFAMGEWYSYAPEIKYNDSDQFGATFSPGIDNSTSIDERYAIAYTVGANVTVPLN